MAWWSDLWLNEGFAEFMSYKGAEHVSPELARSELFVLEQNFQVCNSTFTCVKLIKLNFFHC